MITDAEKLFLIGLLLKHEGILKEAERQLNENNKGMRDTKDNEPTDRIQESVF